MTTCSSCQATIKETMKFCPACGSNLRIQVHQSQISSPLNMKKFIGETDLETFRNLNKQLQDLSTIDQEFIDAKNQYNEILYHQKSLQDQIKEMEGIVAKEYRDVEALQKVLRRCLTMSPATRTAMAANARTTVQDLRWRFP